MIGILILAAGESRRMGEPKMLLPWSGATIIETVANAALASSADEVVVVLGAMEGKIRQTTARLPVTISVNTEFQLGMLSSIQCGLRQVSPDTSAVVLMLGDQPTVPVEVINAVIEAWRESGKGFVLPTHGGRRGHPLLMDMRHGGEVLNLDPSAGMRAILTAHKMDILEVPVDSPSVLKDIDTPEDYATLTGSGGIYSSHP